MSEEREFAHAEWRQSFFDRTSREPTPSEAWYAALKWQAGRQSAGATGQEAVASMDDLSMLIRQLVHAIRKASPDNALAERAMDYLKRKGLQGSPLRAAPIGDNGATLQQQQVIGHCRQGENCVCGGDLPQVRAGCYEWISQPAESKREDFEADAKRLALELECLLLSCKDQAAVSKWWDSAMEALEQHRALLARASAKGE